MSRIGLLTNIIHDIQMEIDHCDGNEYDYSMGLLAAQQIVKEYRNQEEENADEQ